MSVNHMLTILSCYDRDGILDDYVFYLIDSFLELGSDVMVVDSIFCSIF